MREWLVYLVGPAGTIIVRVNSEGSPEFVGQVVRLGDCVFSAERFAGAFPNADVKSDLVRTAG